VLEQRGLVDAIEGAGVRPGPSPRKSSLLTLYRPWFDPMCSAIASGAGMTRRSPMAPTRPRTAPAYVTQLVLVRKLQIELDVAVPAQPPTSWAAPAPNAHPTALAAFAPHAASAEVSRNCSD